MPWPDRWLLQSSLTNCNSCSSEFRYNDECSWSNARKACQNRCPIQNSVLLIQILAAVGTGWTTVTTMNTTVFLVHLKVGRYVSWLVVQGGDHGIDRSLSAIVVDFSSISQSRYSSTSLPTMFPMVSAIRKMNVVLDSNEYTIVLSRSFFWARLSVLGPQIL